MRWSSNWVVRRGPRAMVVSTVLCTAVVFALVPVVAGANVGDVAITQQPTFASSSVIEGQVASVTAAATGDPEPTVQWERSDDTGNTYVPIPGATSPTYSFTTVLADHGAKFRAIFTNAGGSAQSNNATLSVAPLNPPAAPTVSINPFTQPLPVGIDLTITATVTGSPAPLVQWQIVNKPFGLNWINIGTASTTPSITIATYVGLNGLQLRAVATNASGTAIANTPTFNVQYPPAITQHPASKTVASGTAVSFTASAVGNPTPNSTVFWQRSTNGGQTWATFGFNFTTTLTLSAGTVVPSLNGAMYRAQFTNSIGTTNTNPATLTVVAPVAPTVTAGRTVLQGDDVPITFVCSPETSVLSCTAGTIAGDAPTPIPAGFTPTAPLTSGDLLDTSTLGRRTVVVKAVDKVNRVTWTTASFDVVEGGLFGSVPDGGSLSTGGLATTVDPLTTTVRTPAGGFVRIIEGPTAVTAPVGYALFAQQTAVSAPTQSAATPLVSEIGLHTSMTGSGPGSIVVWRDGAVVPRCSATSGTTAAPDPCVVSRAAVSGGARITFRSTTGGVWTFGIVTAVAPSAPVDVAATAGVRSLSVSWSPPSTDGGSPVVSYTVKATPVAGSPGTTRTLVVPAPSTSATMTGLVDGASYAVTVTALNGLVATSGPTSAPIDPVTLPSGPAAAVISDAVAGVRSATVTWSAVSSDRPITYYTVIATALRPDGTTHRVTKTVSGAPPDTTATLTALGPGLAYTFVVTATSAVATSTSPPFGPVTTPALPSTPVVTDAVAGIRAATVTWNAAESDLPVTSYTVVATATRPDTTTHRVTKVITGAPPDTTTTFTGLGSGLTYRFAVTATSAAGVSLASNPSNPVTLPALPTTPVVTDAVAGIRAATVTWNAAESDLPVTSYTVVATATRPDTTTHRVTKVITGTLPDTTTTITALGPGLAYSFTVYATSAVGASPTSTPFGPVTLAALPSTPTVVDAIAGLRAATVTWSPADSELPLTGYTIVATATRPDGTTHRVTKAISGTGTTTTITALGSGLTYTITVSATSAVGPSAPSTPSAPVTIL